MMTSGDDDDEDEGLGVEERTGLVEAVIEVCRLGTFCSVVSLPELLWK